MEAIVCVLPSRFLQIDVSFRSWFILWPSPLARLLGSSTKEIYLFSLKWSILLKNRQIDILQMSLISDILANIHLILGMGVLLGGFGRVKQHSNVTAVDTYSSLLILSVAGLIFPIASQLLATPRPSGIQSFSQALVVIFF